LEDDAMEAVVAYSHSQGISLGKAASKLIGSGSRNQLEIRRINGLPIFEPPEHFPKITSEMVRQLLDED